MFWSILSCRQISNSQLVLTSVTCYLEQVCSFTTCFSYAQIETNFDNSFSCKQSTIQKPTQNKLQSPKIALSLPITAYFCLLGQKFVACEVKIDRFLSFAQILEIKNAIYLIIVISQTTKKVNENELQISH